MRNRRVIFCVAPAVFVAFAAASAPFAASLVTGCAGSSPPPFDPASLAGIEYNAVGSVPESGGITTILFEDDEHYALKETSGATNGEAVVYATGTYKVDVDAETLTLTDSATGGSRTLPFSVIASAGTISSEEDLHVLGLTGGEGGTTEAGAVSEAGAGLDADFLGDASFDFDAGFGAGGTGSGTTPPSTGGGSTLTPADGSALTTAGGSTLVQQPPPCGVKAGTQSLLANSNACPLQNLLVEDAGSFNAVTGGDSGSSPQTGTGTGTGTGSTTGTGTGSGTTGTGTGTGGGRDSGTTTKDSGTGAKDSGMGTGKDSGTSGDSGSVTLPDAGTAALQALGTGLDVSKHQNPIQWAKVVKAGMHFGYAKATEGISYTDPDFVTEFAAMKAAGIRRGAYHFYRVALDPTTQAALFVSVIKAAGYNPATDLAPVVDVESAGGAMIPFVVPRIETFLAAVENKLGVKVIINANRADWRALGNPNLASNPLWIVDVTKGRKAPLLPPVWKTYAIWQGSWTGSIPGATTGPTDLDIAGPGQ